MRVFILFSLLLLAGCGSSYPLDQLELWLS